MTASTPCPEPRNDCDLCEAARITEWFHEDDVCWIAECEICAVPMVVWKSHDPNPPDDVKAARHVFTLAAPAKDERTLTKFGGLWQVARLDEQELSDRTGPLFSSASASIASMRASGRR